MADILDLTSRVTPANLHLVQAALAALAEPPQLQVLEQKLGDLWFLLFQIDSVAGAISVQLEQVVVPGVPGVVSHVERADGLAGAAGALARVALEQAAALQRQIAAARAHNA